MCYDTCLGRNVQGTHRRTLSLACAFASPGVVSKPRFLAAHRLTRRALSCQAQREVPAPPSHTIVDTVDGRARVAPAVHVWCSLVHAITPRSPEFITGSGVKSTGPGSSQVSRISPLAVVGTVGNRTQTLGLGYGNGYGGERTRITFSNTLDPELVSNLSHLSGVRVRYCADPENVRVLASPRKGPNRKPCDPPAACRHRLSAA